MKIGAGPGRGLTAVFAGDPDAAWAESRSWGDELDAGERLLACRFDAVAGIDALIDRIIDALAAVALADWPHWYGTVLPAGIADGAFERNAALRAGLDRVSHRRSNVLPGWLRHAAGCCLGGRPPLQSDCPRELQAGQLAMAISPVRLTVVLGVGAGAHADGAPAVVAVAEWFHRVATATVTLLLPTGWRHCPALERVAIVEQPFEPASGLGATFLPGGATAGFAFAASPLPGLPHPASAAEQLLCKRIVADTELAPLLEFNRTVTVDLGQNFRVDLLCRSRRVVVEVDGAEHRVTAGRYHTDCERDFRLMKHGYLVLRLPNALVLGDVELALSRIRELLRYRSGHQVEGK